MTHVLEDLTHKKEGQPLKIYRVVSWLLGMIYIDVSITSVLKFVPSSLRSLWPFDLRRSILQDISGDLDAMVSHNHAKSTHSPADFWRNNEFREMQMDDPIPNSLLCFFLKNWYRPHSSGQWNMLTPCSTGNTCSKDSKGLFCPCYIRLQNVSHFQLWKPLHLKQSNITSATRLPDQFLECRNSHFPRPPKKFSHSEVSLWY